MLRHYLGMAARSFVQHKLYGFINIAGLSVALTCAILILLFVRDQLSWDAWLPNTRNLYQLDVTWREPGQAPVRLALCPYPVLTAVGKQIPDVRAVTHLVSEKMTVTAGNHQFPETVAVVDPDFFQVIKLPFAEGNPATVLSQPESIVLTQSEARKYFGTADPIGKVLRVSGVWADECKSTDSACYSKSHTLIVTGVIRNLPHNTQLVANLVIPNTSSADEMSQADKMRDWNAGDNDTGFLELAPGTDPSMVLKAIGRLLDRDVPKRLSVDMFRALHARLSQVERFDLIPFRKVHFSGPRVGRMRPAGSRMLVYGFATIGLLIVLVACFNFVNLATARATLRAREIALRKVVGATRGALVAQFLIEASLTAVISLALALSLVEVILPAYDRFLGEPISLRYLSDFRLCLLILAGTIGIGFLSGLYPAFVLSRFRPTATLRPEWYGKGRSGTVRSLLVVGQFAVSIALATAAVVVYQQIKFARDQQWGFNRRNVLVVRGITNVSPATRRLLESALSKGPGIAGAALSTALPFDTGPTRGEIVRLPGSSSRLGAQFVDISPAFPSLLGMSLLAGRWLSPSRSDDVSRHWAGKNVLINATMARALGFSAAQAVGRVIKVIGPAKEIPMRIVGVLGDAMFDSLRSPPRPTLYLADGERLLRLEVRLRGTRIPAALAYIRSTLRSIAPNVSMRSYFLGNAFDELLRPTERQRTMLGAFVAVAVVIACLGLFGLSEFTAARRTKEIGIRKVCGAHTLDIVLLTLWRISVPVVVANAVAWPVAYYYLHRWLDGYAFRIALSPLYFIGAGVGALLVAWATVYGNSLRLARTNPIHTLRYE